MKKNQAIVNEILRRLEQERWDKRLLEKNNKRRRRKGILVPKSATGPKTRQRGKAKPEYVHIPIPSELDLHDNHDEACEIVTRLQNLVKAGQRVCLDFSESRRIGLSALMLLLSQIHKFRLVHGPSTVTGTYPKSNHVDRLLDHSGFYQLLGVKPRGQRKPSRATRYICFKSDTRLSPETISELRSELLGSDLSLLGQVRSTVFRALTEAMLNVGHHAYKTKLVHSRLSNRWWTLAALRVQTNRFTLVFYDAGVGIPKTLPRKYNMETLRQVLSLLPFTPPDDGQMIAAAMELGRSRTGLQNRGKGLLDLARLTEKVPGSEMRIYSRSGSYTYTPTASKHSNHEGFVEGTLIEWRLPIDKALNALPKEIYEEAQLES